MTPPTPIEMLNADAPPIQDYIVLQDQRSPGRATIASAGSPRKWDQQPGWGQSGATLIYVGDQLSEFDVIIDIWEQAHWGQWNRFAKLLEKRSVGLGAKFLSIRHPVLFRAPLRITQVAVRDVTQWEQSPKGLWTCRILMTSYQKPKPALGKPTGTIPGTGAGIDPLLNDPQIKKLSDQVDGLAGRLGSAF